MGMSQEELGFALHMEGKSVIYGYESNRRGISGDILVDLAKLLHSTPEYIMNGESPADEDPYISAVVSLMKGMKTDKRRRIALEHIKIVAEMEEWSWRLFNPMVSYIQMNEQSSVYRNGG